MAPRLAIVPRARPNLTQWRTRVRVELAAGITPFESTEQSALIEWSDDPATIAEYPTLAGPGDRSCIFAIPNGGGRSKREGSLLRANGVRPGVFDLMLPVPVPVWNREDLLAPGLFLELKRRDGGRVSHEQKCWRAYFVTAGYATAIAKGWEEGRDMIAMYLLTGEVES